MPDRNFLNLHLFNVMEVHEEAHDYHVDVETRVSIDKCPHCNTPGAVGFGRRKQQIRDLPMHGKRTTIYVNTRRYRCKACGKTFYEHLPYIEEGKTMTRRLVKWICEQAINRTFVSIAEDVGVSEGTVRLLFKEYGEQKNPTFNMPTPRWLGIDEIYLGKPRGVLADVENRAVLDLLVNRNKSTVISRLSKFKDKERIEFVAIDMWRPYKEAVELVLPQAQIVVDKFHVVRMANDAVEKVRKAMRAGMTAKQKLGLKRDRFLLLKRHGDLSAQELMLLDGWVNSFPDLFKAYRLKEEFYMIYDAADATEAKRRYEAWREAIPETQAHFWHDLVRAWTNWEAEILAHFSHRVTNAYTESLNSVIRVIDRVGRGYSFEALRMKILLMQSGQATDRPGFQPLDLADEERFPVNKPIDFETLMFALHAATF